MKNTTEHERFKYVRLLRCERIFAEELFQEYVEEKCEINIAFKKMTDKIEEQYTAASKREEKKDKSKMAEVYYKIHRILRDMQFLKVLQNSWNELKGYVWSMIEI